MIKDSYYDFRCVAEFHKKFKLPGIGFTSNLRGIDYPTLRFRYRFLREELSELEEATTPVKVLDALIDFVYVAHGTALFLGVTPQNSHIANIWEASGELRSFKVSRREAGLQGLLNPIDRKYIVDSISRELVAFYNWQLSPISAYYHLYKATKLAYQAAILLEFPWEKCWDLVHNANMKKERAAEDASNSKRKSSLDVIKPPNWVSPEPKMKEVLERAGF